uniref:Uncharacterized protein n=1 Tax=Oryza punctata TaxID=4537 RepID=A0A0E0JRG8_ORYPU
MGPTYQGDNLITSLPSSSLSHTLFSSGRAGRLGETGEEEVRWPATRQRGRRGDATAVAATATGRAQVGAAAVGTEAKAGPGAAAVGAEVEAGVMVVGAEAGAPSSTTYPPLFTSLLHTPQMAPSASLPPGACRRGSVVAAAGSTSARLRRPGVARTCGDEWMTLWGRGSDDNLLAFNVDFTYYFMY